MMKITWLGQGGMPFEKVVPEIYRQIGTISKKYTTAVGCGLQDAPQRDFNEQMRGFMYD